MSLPTLEQQERREKLQELQERLEGIPLWLDREWALREIRDVVKGLAAVVELMVP